MMEGLDMNCLTETERDAIFSVIRRNEQLQQAEQQRISKLQSEVKFIRLKGVIKPGQDAAKSCARCRTPFGWFFNKGTICPQCQHRICDTCRVSLEQPGKWLCVLCHKQMQLQAMTGDWFYSKFRKSKRHKRTNKVITGSEIVRTSIHRPTRPNRLSGCNTAATGAANSIGQEVKRALSNNNASPQSKLSTTSADGESSDTQSMEDSYSPRRQLQKDLEGTAFPKDSDRQKLLDLIRPKMQDSEIANSRNATGAEQQGRVEVKHIPSSRYCDSDTSSDSETASPTPPQFLRGNDALLNSESIRSSFRSTVSAISSEGPNTVVTEGISDLDIPTCSSASVSPTAFRKDVTAPSYHKDTQNERLSDNPPSPFADGNGLLGISPTQSRTEIDEEKQAKQTARRSLTKQDSLANDSSDSEGEFTTEQITRMKFRRISVTTSNQNSREGTPSIESPDTPSQPEVFITDNDPSPTSELTDPEPAPTPELSHPPEAEAVIPCVEVEPVVENKSKVEQESEELSTTETEEGAESLSGQQGGQTGGVYKGGDTDLSPPSSSFLWHGGGGGIASGSTPHTNFTPSMVLHGSGTSDSNTPPGEGLLTGKEPLMASPAVTNTPLQTNTDKDGDRLLHSSANFPLSANAIDTDAKHSGSCEVKGEGEASALTLGSEHANAESSESMVRVSTTRERVGALLARLGRSLSQNDEDTVDRKANEAVDSDASSNSSFDDISASNEDFDDLEWDSGLVSGQAEIKKLEATNTNVALMRELRTTGPVQMGLREFDDDADGNLCRSSYKSADTHADLLDDDVDHQGAYYVCVSGDDLATGGYSSSDINPNLLNVNQDSFSDRLSIISERTEPHDFETDDGDTETDEFDDDPDASLNTTVIIRSKHDKKTSQELDECVDGASCMVTRDRQTDKVKGNSDETSISKQGTAVVSETSTSTDARQQEVSQKGGERRRPYPLVKQDTLSRLALEAEFVDTDDTLDLSLMVESNAAYAGDDDIPMLDKSDRGSEDTIDASKQTVRASKQTVHASKQTVHASKQMEHANKQTVHASKDSQTTAATHKKHVTKTPPVEVKKDDTKVLVKKEVDMVKSPTSDESEEPSKRQSILLRRDTITTMALEAIEDGSGDGDEDLAHVFQQNKPYVTDTEVDSIMSEAMVDTKDTDVAKPETAHLAKDVTPMTTFTPIKVQKSSGTSRTKQMSDSKQDVRKSPRRDRDRARDEPVDTSHAMSMSQLMKVFNKPQKFMVPKVAEAYSQKDVGQYREEETDAQTGTQQTERQEQMVEESLQSPVELRSPVEPEPGIVVASVVSTETSGPVKPERTFASATSAEQVNSAEDVKHEKTVVMSVEQTGPVKQGESVASVISVEKSVENTSMNVMDVKPTGDKELDLHVSFHDLEAESSTDGTVKGIGECADDSASSDEEERSNLETELKTRFGVLDEESVTDDVTSRDHHKVLIRVPSIVVTLASGNTSAEEGDEEDTPPEDIVNATDSVKETQDKDSDGYTEEAADAEFEHHDAAEWEHSEEHVQGDSETSRSTDEVMGSAEEAEEEKAGENECDVAVMKYVEEIVGDSFKIEKKNSAMRGSEAETVNVVKIEEDDKPWVDNTDEGQQSDTEETDRHQDITAPDGQLKQSSVIDEKDFARDSEEAEMTEVTKDAIAERIEKNVAEDENQMEKVEEFVAETETDVAPVSSDASFMSVLQGIMLTGDKSYGADTGEHDDVDIQAEDHYVAIVREVKLSTDENGNNNDMKSDVEIETVNVSEMERVDKLPVDSDVEEEQSIPEEKTENSDSPDTQVTPTSLASLDTNSKRRSNLEIFLNRGHPPDPNDPPPVEGVHTPVEGQPTLLSLANRLAATLVKGISPESDLSLASQHAPPPPTDTLPAQSSTMATEIPTEEPRHNGRLSSSLKSTASESENQNRTGCDPEVDIVVTPGGDSDTRPRSPSSIPSPAVMRSKRALEGVCELDEDRQSSDSYPVTPRTDSPSSMSSSHYSRGQQSSRSTNLLTPFSVSTESMMSYYSDAGEGNYGKIPVTGEIQFGLDYNYKNSVFEVAIRQCKDIAVVDTKKKRSDPYVKTYLLPDRTKNGKRKTRVKKHTLNPVFDEILKYHVTKSELETRTLWVTVWHNDTFGRNDFLGEVTLPLDYYEFGDSSAQWYKLQERPKPAEDEYGNPLPLSLLTYKGDLNLSLRFVSPENLPGRKKDGRCGSKGSLHVLIKQARNLTAVRANGSSDPFCKGYLLPDKVRRIKQKTPVLKKNCNPAWNHTMIFDNVSWDELKDYCLELTIWDYDRFTSNDFLGGVRLNLGSGKSGGKEVDWMDAKGDETSIWQAMLDRPNYWIDGTLMVRPNMDRRK